MYVLRIFMVKKFPVALIAIPIRISTWLKARFFPYSWLPPILRFKRDGWNERIYNSAPPVEGASVVIFGGYLGQSTHDWMRRLPGATFDVFEPVPTFADQIRLRFPENEVRVHPYGVSQIYETRVFRILGDATFSEGALTPVKRGGYGIKVPVEFRAASELERILPSRIYILEVNIEGGEYELLPLLVRHEVITRVHHVFVQFHDVGKDTEGLIANVREEIMKSHELVWGYHLVWEYWRLRVPTLQ